MSMLAMELKDFAGRKITFNELGRRAQRILARRSVDRCMDVLNEGAINIRNVIVQGMRDSPPTGKLYARGKTKKGKRKYHRASSAGNYPRVDSGGLVRSIGIDARFDEVEVGSRITDPPYPGFLEKGTDKMEARPWLERSSDKEKPDIKRNLMEVLRQSARDFRSGGL